MGCNCNETPTPCNQNPCQEPQDCSCPVKDLSTDCSTYTGDDLACSGIKKGTILTSLIQQLDAFICDLRDELIRMFTIVNIGSGARWFKGTDALARKVFRTAVSTSPIITIQEASNDNEVEFGIDEDELNDFIEANQKTYSVTNVGDGAEIYKTPDIVLGDNTEFQIKTLDYSNVGDGVGILKELDTTTDDNKVIIVGKTIVTDNLYITEEEDVIRINTPVPTSNLSFYVDVNSTADTETGSLSFPFKTLNKALDAFIGGGSWMFPQYSGYKITLLSDCNLIENAGLDYNGYVNLDINNLDIEGNGFYLGLIANPSPDYYPISTRRMVNNMDKTAGVLNYQIHMRFNNITIGRWGTNAVIDNLNYSFPTANLIGAYPPSQNGVDLWITNCRVSNDTNKLVSGNFSTVPNPNDGGNPLLMFGVPIYASSTEPWGVPMVKTEGRNWNKEGNFRMGNCKLQNSTGTAFYLKNTTYQEYYEFSEMGMDNYRRLYESEVDDYYSPRLGTYMIEAEDVNYFILKNLRINWTTPRMDTTELVPRSRIVGGVESYYKLTNASLHIEGNSSDQDQVVNLVQLDGTSVFSLNGYRNDGQITDDVNGLFKVIAPLPVSAIQLGINNSSLYNVKLDTTGVDKSFIQQLNGTGNWINNAPHSSYLYYANDTDAKAAGLIRGNVYYNTTAPAKLKTVE